MNTNVIISASVSLPFGRYNGDISIIGDHSEKYGSKTILVIMARAEELQSLVRRCDDGPTKVGRCNHVISTIDNDNRGVIILECRVDKVRNPHKLLKSIRSKLVCAARSADGHEWEEEKADEEWQKFLLAVD